MRQGRSPRPLGNHWPSPGEVSSGPWPSGRLIPSGPEALQSPPLFFLKFVVGTSCVDSTDPFASCVDSTDPCASVSGIRLESANSIKMQSRGRLVSATPPSEATPGTPDRCARPPRPARISPLSRADLKKAADALTRSLISTPSASRSPTYFRVPRHSLKMLRGSLALTGYRPFNEQPSPPLHSHHVRSTLCPWGPGGLGRPFG